MSITQLREDVSSPVSLLFSPGELVAVKLKRAPKTEGTAVVGTIRTVNSLGFRMRVLAFLADGVAVESFMELAVPWRNLEWAWASNETDDVELFIYNVLDELGPRVQQALKVKQQQKMESLGLGEST